MKINLKNLKSQSGITLSSLIVTIIVMMILSVASVSILSGNTGILDETEVAVNEANKQVIIDEVKIMISKFAVQWDGKDTLRSYIVGKLESYEDGYETDTGGKITVSENGYVTYTDKDERTIVFEGEYGLTKLRIDEWGNVGEVAYVPPPNGLKIGDSVTYETVGDTYTWQAEYCSSNKTPETDDVILSSKEGGDFRITEWKVFDIDKDTGEIELISAEPTTGTVYLGEAQGYNNGVYLLNEACSKLYGNESSIIARSINIDDIESRMLEAVLGTFETAPNASKGAKYRNQVTSAYKVNKRYPLIYEQETNSVINGKNKINGLGLSESGTVLIGRDDESIIEVKKDENEEETPQKATDGYILASVSIQPYQTCLYKSNDFMQTSFKAPEGLNETEATTNTNYNLLMMNGANTTTYWLASRCIDTGTTNCTFRISYVKNGGLSAYHVYNSNNHYSSISLALRPVLFVSSSSIDGNSTNGWFVKQ